MTTETRPMGLLNALLGLCLIAVVIIAGAALWPYAKGQIGTMPAILIATSAPAAPAQPARPVQPVRPITQPNAAPITNPNVASSPGEADSLVATAIAAQAAAPGNVEGVKVSPRGSVDTDIGEKPAPDQHNAIIILPTVAAPTDGSPPNPSKGQCLHGQVFTTHGCKNPSSVTP